MVKWVTCREPQGRAIGKTHIDKEVQDVYKLKPSFENQHSNIPSFHYSIIPCVRQKEHASINHLNFPAFAE
jgi:hypothetical protein